MDRVLNPKDEKKTIYEIYRACRLCGAGAGYKMPIIQTVVDLESHGMELRQKIKECTQIEVNHTDRMPPLICELCVDKVNDFYDFLTLCQQTNKRTRQRLGLPLPTKSRDSVECENCILGVTEPINTDSEAERVSGPSSKKTRVKKEPVEQVRVKRERERENGRFAPSRSSTPSPACEVRRRSPPHKRPTRRNADSFCIDVELIEDKPEPRSKLKRAREKEVKIDTNPPIKKVKLPEPKPKETPKPGPKSKTMKAPEPPKPVAKDPEPPKTTSKPKPASKKEIKPSPPTSKPSKARSKPEPVKARPEPVKTKPEPVKTKPEPVKTKPEPVKTKPEPVKTRPDVKSKPAEEPVKPKAVPKSSENKFTCLICQHQVKTPQGLAQHNVVKHVPTFTAAKFACNACELWFPTVEQCAAHHRAHRDGQPYKCVRCYGYFKLQHEYESHFSENQCLSVYEVPDVQCWRCSLRFATGALLAAHRCLGEDARPGGKCSKCNKSFTLLKNQLEHEASCTYNKESEVKIEPEVQARLLNMQVKVARCDPLLSGPRVRVPSISHKYGLDSKAHYPYLPARIKREPPAKALLEGTSMVTIEDTVKAEYWGSDSNDSQTVDSLSSITLKTINKVDKGDDKDALAEKIFSIIDNLGVDDVQSSFDTENLDKVCDKQSDGESKSDKDNVSDGNDNSQGGSDSILDNNDDKTVDTSRVNDESDEMKVVKDIPETDSVVAGEEPVPSAAADFRSDETNVDSDSIGRNADADKMDVDAEKMDDSPKQSEDSSVTIDDTEKMDVNCENSQVSNQNVYASSEKSEDKLTTELDKRLSDSVEETVDDKDPKNEEMDVEENDNGAISSKEDENKPNNICHDELKTDHNDLKNESTDVEEKDNGATSSKEDEHETNNICHDELKTDDNDPKNEETDVEEKDNGAISSNEDEHETNNICHDELKTNKDADITNEQIRIETSKSTDSETNAEENSVVMQSFSPTNNECLKNDNIDSSNQLTQDCSLDFNEDKLEIDKNSDKINSNIHKTDKIDVNQDKSYPQLTNNEVFSKIDEITNKILKETETCQENSTDEHRAIEKRLTCDNHSDSISLNSLKSVNDIELRDKFNVDDLSDDDKKLMAELDAQIGEITEKNQNNDHETPNDENIKENDHKGIDNDGNGNDCNVNNGIHDNVDANDTSGFNNSCGAEGNVNPDVYNQNGQSNYQINGPNEQRRESDQKSKDYLIDNILKKQDDLKSLELDSISDDEFNFDA